MYFSVETVAEKTIQFLLLQFSLCRGKEVVVEGETTPRVHPCRCRQLQAGEVHQTLLLALAKAHLFFPSSLVLVGTHRTAKAIVAIDWLAIEGHLNLNQPMDEVGGGERMPVLCRILSATRLKMV